jgi:GYF domain 2
MVEVLKIHLARPGGEKEGPFGLDELNEGLATGKLQATEYWAWHEGLPQWVPLYEIEGILKNPVARGPKPAENTAAEMAEAEATPAEEPAEVVTNSPEEAPPAALAQIEPEERTELAAAEPGEGLAPLLDTAEALEDPVAENSNGLAAEDEPTGPAEPGVEGSGTAGERAEAEAVAGNVELDESEAGAPELDLDASGPESTPGEPELAPVEANEPDVDLPAAGKADAPQPQSDDLDAQPLATMAPADEAAPAEEGPAAPNSDALTARCSSGMPFEALEQIFIFTTGDGVSVWESPRVGKVLQAITGQEVSVIRQSVPRDVMFNCQTKQLLKADGSISDVAWRAMSIRQPEIVQRAQAKFSRTCVCTFTTELKATVALVLFYRNEPGSAEEADVEGELSAAVAQPA